MSNHEDYCNGIVLVYLARAGRVEKINREHLLETLLLWGEKGVRKDTVHKAGIGRKRKGWKLRWAHCSMLSLFNYSLYWLEIGIDSYVPQKMGTYLLK